MAGGNVHGNTNNTIKKHKGVAEKPSGQALKIKHKTMPAVIARHKAGDINALLKSHQERVDLFAPAVAGFKTYQDTDDPNSVVLVIDATDLEKLGAIINDPASKGIKYRHTVIEPVTMGMPVEL